MNPYNCPGKVQRKVTQWPNEKPTFKGASRGSPRLCIFKAKHGDIFFHNKINNSVSSN